MHDIQFKLGELQIQHTYYKTRLHQGLSMEPAFDTAAKLKKVGIFSRFLSSKASLTFFYPEVQKPKLADLLAQEAFSLYYWLQPTDPHFFNYTNLATKNTLIPERLTLSNATEVIYFTNTHQKASPGEHLSIAPTVTDADKIVVLQSKFELRISSTLPSDLQLKVRKRDTQMELLNVSLSSSDTVEEEIVLQVELPESDFTYFEQYELLVGDDAPIPFVLLNQFPLQRYFALVHLNMGGNNYPAPFLDTVEGQASLKEENYSITFSSRSIYLRYNIISSSYEAAAFSILSVDLKQAGISSSEVMQHVSTYPQAAYKKNDNHSLANGQEAVSFLLDVPVTLQEEPNIHFVLKIIQNDGKPLYVRLPIPRAATPLQALSSKDETKGFFTDIYVHI